MQTAKEITPIRLEPKKRGEDARTANRYPVDVKQAAAADKTDLPTWDEV